MKTILVNTKNGYEVVNIDFIVRWRDHNIITTNGSFDCMETAEEISKLVDDATVDKEPCVVPVPDCCYVAVDDDGCINGVYLSKDNVPPWFPEVKQAKLNS